MLVKLVVTWCRMAPEVIACDEDPDATYDNRVSIIVIITSYNYKCSESTNLCREYYCHLANKNELIHSLYISFKNFLDPNRVLDRHQNLTTRSLGLPKNKSKSVHDFLSNLEDGQTDRHRWKHDLLSLAKMIVTIIIIIIMIMIITAASAATTTCCIFNSDNDCRKNPWTNLLFDLLYCVPCLSLKSYCIIKIQIVCLHCFVAVGWTWSAQVDNWTCKIFCSNQKKVSCKKAMDTPAQANLIWCTLVHKWRKIGPEFWPTQRVAITLGLPRI